MCAGLENEIQLIKTKRCKPGNIFGKKPTKTSEIRFILGCGHFRIIIKMHCAFSFCSTPFNDNFMY